MDTYYMSTAEISSAISSYDSNLTQSLSQSDLTLSTLNDFSESSVTTLVGDVWNDIRSNLENYRDCLELSSQVNETINRTNKECLQMIQKFLGSDTELNTADLPKFEEQKVKLETEIASLEKENESLARVPETIKVQIGVNEFGSPIYEEQHNPAWDAAQAKIAENNNRIANVLTPQLNETNRLINKINDFNNVVLPAVIKKLDTAEASLQKFMDEVDKIMLSLGNNATLRKEFDSKFSNTITLNMFKQDPKNGFELFLSSHKYTMDDFKNSKLRGLVDQNGNNNGYTAEQAYEAFIGVIIAEAGSAKTIDEILAVASVALNRCDQNYGNKGSNPFDQMFMNGGNQYETITKVDDYYRGSGITDQNGRPINPYEVYMPSIMGRDRVDKELAKHGSLTYDEIVEVVDMAMNGLRNNDYDQFVASEDVINSNSLNNGGNSYTYSKFDSYSMNKINNAKAARGSVTIDGAVVRVEEGSNVNDFIASTSGHVQTQKGAIYDNSGDEVIIVDDDISSNKQSSIDKTSSTNSFEKIGGGIMGNNGAFAGTNWKNEKPTSVDNADKLILDNSGVPTIDIEKTDYNLTNIPNQVDSNKSFNPYNPTYGGNYNDSNNKYNGNSLRDFSNVTGSTEVSNIPPTTNEVSSVDVTPSVSTISDTPHVVSNPSYISSNISASSGVEPYAEAITSSLDDSVPLNEIDSNLNTLSSSGSISSTTVESGNNSNLGKTILTAAGVTAAVGAAAGAAVYGMNQVKNNNDFSEEDYSSEEDDI